MAEFLWRQVLRSSYDVQQNHYGLSGDVPFGQLDRVVMAPV
jgi:hypothetical protein